MRRSALLLVILFAALYIGVSPRVSAAGLGPQTAAVMAAPYAVPVAASAAQASANILAALMRLPLALLRVAVLVPLKVLTLPFAVFAVHGAAPAADSPPMLVAPAALPGVMPSPRVSDDAGGVSPGGGVIWVPS